MSRWTIGEATDGQREELVRLEREFFGEELALRSRWILDGNPSGKALVLVATGPGNRIAGTRSLLPWTLLVDGRQVRVGQYSRTWTHPDFRNRGVSVELGEALNRSSADRGYPMVMLFPSVRSIPGHRRIGNELDWILERRQAFLSPRFFWSGSPRMLDAPLARCWRLAARRAGRASGRWRVEEDPGRLADRLWPGRTAQRGVEGIRDGTFVRWRFSRESGRDYRAWSYPGQEPGRLLAFTHTDGMRARILDLWGELAPEETAAALVNLVEHLAGNGAGLVEWCPPRFGSDSRLAGRAGFFPRRPGVPLARWFNVPREELGSLAVIDNYRLTEGDSDYA